MIYTCIADGIRSPPAFFLKNKYKEPIKCKMKTQNAYGCMREFPVMMAKHFAASVRLLRPGYCEMMRQVKAGEIDCIYIYRMRQISGKEQHLFRFFQQVMQHGIKVVTLEYSLRDRLHEYRLGMKIENYAARHKLPFPW